jgi:hypothetical protein
MRVSLSLGNPKMMRLLITDSWFSIFQRLIEWIKRKFSLGYRLNHSFEYRYEKTRGVSESYVLLRLIFGFLWLSLINTLPFSIMASPLAWKLGGWLAVYLMFDIFIFTLNWIFVDVIELEAIRRSLFFFLINILEIVLYSSIALILFRCTNKSPFGVFYECFGSIFQFELFKVSDNCGFDGRFVIHFQLIIGFLLILVVVAGLAGSIRKGKEEGVEGGV